MQQPDEKVHEQQEWLRVTLSSIGDAVITTDIRGAVTFLNPVAEKLTGWPLAEAVGQPLPQVFQIVNEESRQTVENPTTKALREGLVVGLANHTLLVSRDGTERPIDDSAAPIRNLQNEVAGAVLVFRDVTEQRRQERILRESEERFRLLVDSVKDYAIFMLDPQGFVASWNPGAERIKGYHADEIIGQHFRRFYPEEVAATGFPEYELQVADRDGRFEDEGWRVRKDGSRFWANVVITAVRDEQGRLRGFSKVTRDLTERKAAEDRNAAQQDELRRSEERFRLMIESVKDYAIFMLDPEGHVINWNAGAQQIKGYMAEEIIGQHFSRFYTPEANATNFPQHELETAAAVGRFEDEGWRVRKDGTLFWADVVITAVRDESGKLLGFVKVTRDLTQQRELERANAQSEALADLNRRKDEFLAMLSHELRNPLAPISTAVQLLRLDLGDDPSRQPAISILERQVAHLTRLVNDLLEVSRISTGRIRLQPELIDLRRVAERAIEAVHVLTAQRQHRVSMALPAEPVWLHADPTRIEQVIVNLLTNATKYTNPEGEIRLSVEQTLKEAVLRVADTGVGIAPEMLPNVFDLFTQGERSLDRSEGGLGVGLTVVKRITELHGGSVEAQSEGLGHGSEFVVRLPLDGQAASAPACESGQQPQPAGCSLRVLVVDDNRDAANTIAMLLRKNNYHVEVAYSGESAIEAAMSHQPDAVLLDIGLPKIDGYEVARRFRQNPQLRHARIVAVSGYGQDSDKQRSQEAGFDAHMVKPVEPKKLYDYLLTIPKSEAAGDA